MKEEFGLRSSWVSFEGGSRLKLGSILRLGLKPGFDSRVKFWACEVSMNGSGHGTSVESESESSSESESTGRGSLRGSSFRGLSVLSWASRGGDTVGGVWVVFWVEYWVVLVESFCGVGGLEVEVPSNPSGLKIGGEFWGSSGGVVGFWVWWSFRGFSGSERFSVGFLSRGFLGGSSELRFSAVEGSSFFSKERNSAMVRVFIRFSSGPATLVSTGFSICLPGCSWAASWS